MSVASPPKNTQRTHEREKMMQNAMGKEFSGWEKIRETAEEFAL